MIYLRQYMSLMHQNLKLERAEPQRAFSSFMFGVCILFLFMFAMGELPPNLKLQFVLSEIFLCVFLVLQLVHQRILSSEEEDRAMDVLIVSPISLSVLYLAKVSLAILISAILVFPFLGLTQIFYEVRVFDLTFLGILGLVGFALSSLGVLLSQMTHKASGRDLLFPILYFPLTLPVLLSAVQASLCHWGLVNSDSLNLWMGLLVVFCITYFTLGVLLFEELLGLD